MNNEQKILDSYISGAISGEAQKLEAAIGSLNARRTEELTSTILALRNTINSSVRDLMINNGSNADNIVRGVDASMDFLGKGIEIQVANLIRSNERLSESNEKYTFWIKWLTFGLVLASIAQVTISFLSYIKTSN